MRHAPDIRFVGIEPSGALASAARDRVAKLELSCPAMTACDVVIELGHRHRRQGRPFAVRIDVTLSGHAGAVSRVENEDVYVALRDAFDHMGRQLEDTMRRMQAFVREPATPVVVARPEDIGGAT